MLYLPPSQVFYTLPELRSVRSALKHRVDLAGALIAGKIKPEALLEAVGYTQRYGDFADDFNARVVDAAIAVYEARRAVDKVIYGEGGQ